MSTGSAKKQANQLIDFTSTYTAQRLGVRRAEQDTQTRTDEIKQISEQNSSRIRHVTDKHISNGGWHIDTYTLHMSTTTNRRKDSTEEKGGMKTGELVEPLMDRRQEERGVGVDSLRQVIG